VLTHNLLRSANAILYSVGGMFDGFYYITKSFVATAIYLPKTY